MLIELCIFKKTQLSILKNLLKICSSITVMYKMETLNMNDEQFHDVFEKRINPLKK